MIEIKVRTSATSAQVSLRTPGDIPSGSREFLGYNPDSNFCDFKTGHVLVSDIHG